MTIRSEPIYEPQTNTKIAIKYRIENVANTQTLQETKETKLNIIRNIFHSKSQTKFTGFAYSEYLGWSGR